ncbi:Transposable element Tcb2 transposase-like 7 [Homarus americanus]|uniref:Transposable element Tcb2 transposase-like 7 n=1 Tax=Homarus americanus TaxID=6706 RepID=A0A8J5N6R7_HOMAM|nr:Transposable element Tcb2 transposase-like 7 [Homarus americanus]
MTLHNGMLHLHTLLKKPIPDNTYTLERKDFNYAPGLTKVGGACDHLTVSHTPPATKAACFTELKSFKASHLHLKHAAAPSPPGAIPKRKVGSGAVRKTSIRTDNILKHEVMSDPAVTASTQKKKHPDLLKHVAIRTVQHRLQKDHGLPTRRAAKKPLLTEAMKTKRINFCKKYQHWTSDDWKKVMFSDESTFRLVRWCLEDLASAQECVAVLSKVHRQDSEASR